VPRSLAPTNRPNTTLVSAMALHVVRTLAALVAIGGGASAVEVPRYAVLEVPLAATGQYDNPYTEGSAEATFTEPDGKTTRTVPLFWDGGAGWKFRFAPDKLGKWAWTTTSTDAGLNGKTGTFECVASKLPGGLQPDPKAGHHFQRHNGDPV
jgi:hypothetical protein